jgi:glycosyltransferase involved in cell wall biosynthesis
MQKESVVLSYIISVFNKADYIKTTIESIAFQSRDVMREVVFVDDCSTDNSIEVIESLQRKFESMFLQFKIVKNSVNSGPSVSNSNGAKVASGEWLFFIDADDVLIANSENEILKIIITDKIDFLISKDIKTSEFNFNLQMKSNPDYFVYSQDLLENLLRLKFNYPLFVRKSLMEQVGFFNEKIFVQDVNIFLKLAIHAKRFAFLKVPKVQILVNEDPKKESANLVRQHVCGFFAFKYALDDYARSLTNSEKNALMKKAVSVLWKFFRNDKLNWIKVQVLFVYIMKNIFTKQCYDFACKFFAKFENIDKNPTLK